LPRAHVGQPLRHHLDEGGAPYVDHPAVPGAEPRISRPATSASTIPRHPRCRSDVAYQIRHARCERHPPGRPAPAKRHPASIAFPGVSAIPTRSHPRSSPSTAIRAVYSRVRPKKSRAWGSGRRFGILCLRILSRAGRRAPSPAGRLLVPSSWRPSAQYGGAARFLQRARRQLPTARSPHASPPAGRPLCGSDSVRSVTVISRLCATRPPLVARAVHSRTLPPRVGEAGAVGPGSLVSTGRLCLACSDRGRPAPRRQSSRRSRQAAPASPVLIRNSEVLAQPAFLSPLLGAAVRGRHHPEVAWYRLRPPSRPPPAPPKRRSLACRSMGISLSRRNSSGALVALPPAWPTFSVGGAGEEPWCGRTARRSGPFGSARAVDLTKALAAARGHLPQFQMESKESHSRFVIVTDSCLHAESIFSLRLLHLQLQGTLLTTFHGRVQSIAGRKYCLVLHLHYLSTICCPP